MFRNAVTLVLLLGLLSGCASTQVPSFPEPAVRSWGETVGWNRALLTASFDNPEGIVACGFWLSTPGAAAVKVPSMLDGDTISYEWTGLEASTDYVWWVYYSNGIDEVEVRSRSFTTECEPYDPALWQYLLGAFDKDGDKDLSESESSAVTEIDLSGITLSSLSGLEVLMNLETLKLDRNGLEVIDVSPLKKLVFLTVKNQPQLKEIVMDNPLLYSTFFTVDSPYLKSIDYSRCPDLGMIGWHGVQVGSVDLSHNPKLYYFNLGGSALKELDLSASAIFERLISRDNPSLETVWLKKGTVLSECEIEPHTKILYK